MSPDLRSEIRQSRPFSSPEQEAFLSIGRTWAVLEHMFSEALRPYGITATQYNVLRILRGASERGLCRAEVMERMITMVPDATRLLDRMEAAGLIERQHPGKRKTGKQVSFSSDLIYDVLRKYEPDHLLLTAAWADARTKLSDIARLNSLLERSQHSLVHRSLDRVSPLAVPILLDLGRQRVEGEATDDALLAEADALIAEAMG